MSDHPAPLTLDHLTLADATPAQLATAAAAADCTGICLFLQAMDVLPTMPAFDLVTDHAARRALKAQMADLGLRLELAYPFTLAGRTDIAAFAPALACAAELEARRVNLLIYDREPDRAAARFAAFCDLADSFGLGVALEFYPASQVPSLAAAQAYIRAVNRPGRVGINVDLLHLMRSGGTLAELAAVPQADVLFAQLADGPATRPQADWESEAATDRRPAGDGDFDLAGFAAALPAGCPMSIEIPCAADLMSGLSHSQRAQKAVTGVRRALAKAA